MNAQQRPGARPAFTFTQLIDAVRLMKRADFKRSFPTMRESEIERQREMLDALVRVLEELAGVKG